MKLEMINDNWARISFFNTITKKPGQLLVKRPMNCKQCGKEITKDFCKNGSSFDWYHTGCIKEANSFTLIIDDIE